MKKLLALTLLSVSIFFFKELFSNSSSSHKLNKKKTSHKLVQTKKSVKALGLKKELPSHKKAEVITALDLVKDERQLEALINFINDENSYAGKNTDPHSQLTLLHDEEGALRVHGLKKIVKNLNEKSSEKVLNRISKEAKDETIRQIASEILRYRKEGKSFFEEFTGAIRSLPIPD